LQQQQVKASFFFTGRFYEKHDVHALIKQGHYLGPHSDQHLLYCDWTKRDSLLVTENEFRDDMKRCLAKMSKAGVDTGEVRYFIPPYEWWNNTIAEWAGEMGLQIVNFTPGTGSNADYTYPEMGAAYKSSAAILKSIAAFRGGLNGVILLIHAGTDPRRKDKLYDHLGELIMLLKKEGYSFRRIDEAVHSLKAPMVLMNEPVSSN
jgi:peptidoglycan/xylan/chitin deacetylase (PgdA/CDA1 family)